MNDFETIDYLALPDGLVTYYTADRYKLTNVNTTEDDGKTWHTQNRKTYYNYKIALSDKRT